MHNNTNPKPARPGSRSWSRRLKNPQPARTLTAVLAAAMALAVAATALGPLGAAQAQDVETPPEHSGAVTIVAQHPTALQGIDDLVFTVTRAVAADNALTVQVTLASDDAQSGGATLSVTIPAGKRTGSLAHGTAGWQAETAVIDVTATVDGGSLYDVGDPSTATVRLYLGDGLVTVRLNAGSYTLAESVGTDHAAYSVTVKTKPGVPAPNTAITVAIDSQDGTATSADDYLAVSRSFAFGGASGRFWWPVGDTYVSAFYEPLTVIDDGKIEGDETFQLKLTRGAGTPSAVLLAPADSDSPACTSSECSATVTITDDDARGVTLSETGRLSVVEGDTETYTVVLDSEPTGNVTVTPEVRDGTDAAISVSGALTFTPADWDSPQTVTVTAAADGNDVHGSATIIHTVAGADYGTNSVTAASVPVIEGDLVGRTVVSLVQVPDGTVVRDGSTVLDGSTFAEGDPAWYRILLSSEDGGRVRGGVDVELSYEWNPGPLSGQTSRATLGLPRVDHWDGAVSSLEDEVGNGDGTVTVRITGCERSGCIIGTPSEITLTIADDDGGPNAAPPGRVAEPGLLCPASPAGYVDTGVHVIWQAPDGGAPIEHYEVSYRHHDLTNGWLRGAGDWQAWPHGRDETSATITGLDADALYGARVRAVNANGPGEWSYEGFAWTGQPDWYCDFVNSFYSP